MQSLWSRWFRRPVPERQPFLRIVEFESAPAGAAELFLRTFRQPIPVAPRHFVLQLAGAERDADAVLGYVHFQAFEQCYLAGGLVVDAWRFRELPAPLQHEIRQHGGMAEWLMTEGCRSLTPCLAVYAYIGDKKSETVNARVGFRFTGFKHLFVYVRDATVPMEVLEMQTRAVAALGPF